MSGVGISYKRHFRTKTEIRKDIAELEKLSLSKEEHDKRLKELQKELTSRNQIHAPRTRKSKVKTDNMQSLRRSQKSLMGYLYANFDYPFVRMSTLTYAIKVYDLKIAMKDTQAFTRKLRKIFPGIVWLAYFDFHKDKSIHTHLIFKNAKGATHELLTKLWGKGCVYVTRFEQEKIPYLCKSLEKLELYPSGVKLFTRSQNCKKPVSVAMSVETFQQITQDMECTHSSAKTLYKQEKPVNHYIYKNFKKRKED